MSEITIRPYLNQDYEAVKKIVLSTFSQTAYHTDAFFTKQQADEFLWIRWAKPALTNKNPKCFVATYKNDVIGFLLYGIFSSLEKHFHILIGNIILLGVDKKFQNYKIGTKLVAFVIEFFKQHNIQLITVGTDLDNIPAIKIYQKNNFYITLPWSTFRWHSATNNKITVEFQKYPNIDLKHLITPPNSFLEDSFFTDEEKQKIQQDTLIHLENKLKTGKIAALSTKQGVLLYQTETVPSVATTLIKIVGYYGDLPYLLECLESHLFTSLPSFIIEFFIKSNDWNTIRILLQSHFSLIHNAVTMHCRIQS